MTLGITTTLQVQSLPALNSLYLTRRISRSDLLLFRSRFPSFSLHAQAYQDDRNEDEEMYEEDHAQVDQAGDEDEAD